MANAWFRVTYSSASLRSGKTSIDDHLVQVHLPSLRIHGFQPSAGNLRILQGTLASQPEVYRSRAGAT